MKTGLKPEVAEIKMNWFLLLWQAGINTDENIEEEFSKESSFLGETKFLAKLYESQRFYHASSTNYLISLKALPDSQCVEGYKAA
jgi:hypothetical protein